MTFENVVKIAQKYLSNKPVIILGTGATIPYGLPSMTQLANELISRVVINPTEGDYNLWNKFKNDLLSTKDIEISLHNIELSKDLLSLVIRHSWEIINEKDLIMYNKLIHNGYNNPFASLLQYFLRTSSSLINIVTTNYDRFAEYSADIAGANIFLGFTPNLIGRFIADTFDNNRISFPSRNSQVNIFKVHGSLDWFLDNNKIPISIPNSRIIPDKFEPSIVTPGISKYRITHNDPFRTIMALGDQAIRRSSCILCIGYGFNDDHVQTEIINIVKVKSIPIILITKSVSNAAKDILLNDHCKKVLLIEEADSNSSKIYTTDIKDGFIIENCSLWKLEDFNNIFMERNEI